MMGLLDQIVGGVLGGGSAPGADPGSGAGPMDLMQLLMTLLAGSAQGGGLGGGQGGGLAGLLEQLSAAGLGDQVKSWVASGPNLPVSADQLHGAFGSDTMGRLAERMGLSTGDLGAQLAQMLPQAVDRVTPQGRLPEGDLGDLGSLLGGLFGR